MEIDVEKKFRIKTSSVEKSASKEFFHYQGASYLVLFQIFKEIFEQTKNMAFIDIGSGKGRVIFVAENLGYNHLTGIELDEKLLAEAKKNEKLFLFKRKESEIHFIHADALDFNYKSNPTLYFLFNPFSENVLRKVLEKICQSTTAETWFVYMNPMFTKPFQEKNMDVLKKLKTRFYTEAIIYRLNPASIRS